jgi:hypothetical protein
MVVMFGVWRSKAKGRGGGGARNPRGEEAWGERSELQEWLGVPRSLRLSV